MSELVALWRDNIHWAGDGTIMNKDRQAETF
jgi:hypothetical protein